MYHRKYYCYVGDKLEIVSHEIRGCAQDNIRSNLYRKYYCIAEENVSTVIKNVACGFQIQHVYYQTVLSKEIAKQDKFIKSDQIC